MSQNLYNARSKRQTSQNRSFFTHLWLQRQENLLRDESCFGWKPTEGGRHQMGYLEDWCYLLSAIAVLHFLMKVFYSLRSLVLNCSLTSHVQQKAAWNISKKKWKKSFSLTLKVFRMWYYIKTLFACLRDAGRVFSLRTSPGHEPQTFLSNLIKDWIFWYKIGVTISSDKRLGLQQSSSQPFLSRNAALLPSKERGGAWRDETKTAATETCPRKALIESH